MNQAVSMHLGYKITIYDALYVALAEQLGFPLVTADEVMLKRLKGHIIVVPCEIWPSSKKGIKRTRVRPLNSI